MDDIIILEDELGNEVEFELLDVIEYYGEEYAVLIETDADDDAPVQILRMISEDLDSEDVTYEGIDDEDIIEGVYKLFRKRNGL